jgi:allantoinase
LTEKPAEFINFGNRKGTLQIGYDADFVIWDPEKQVEILKSNILFKHKISPYIGTTLFGYIHMTIVNGEPVFKDNHIIQQNKGQWLIHQ